MWSSESSFESGIGPFGLGPTPSPFALTQASVWRLGVMPAATGYAAVGTRPRSLGAGGAAAAVAGVLALRSALVWWPLRLPCLPRVLLCVRRFFFGAAFGFGHPDRSAYTTTSSSPDWATVR